LKLKERQNEQEEERTDRRGGLHSERDAQHNRPIGRDLTDDYKLIFELTKRPLFGTSS